MSFLNPLFLFGAFVLAVPVLIHLVRREKTEIIPFSSLMFLLKVPKRSIRQQQIKNLLLMLLRLLLLALLVAVFMRPYLTQGNTPTINLGTNRGYVMLLDNSYSMRYGTNFDRMKDEAGKRIEALRDNDRMALISFNENATVLAMPTPDKGKLRAAVAALEPSFAGTRYYDAFSAADRVMGGLGDDERHLIMISDFQRVGWSRTSHENVIGHEVKAEMVPVGAETANKSTNLGIDNVSVDATTFTRAYPGRIVARIHNYRKDGPANVPVSLVLNDKEVKRNTVTVPANGVATTEFAGFDLQPGFSKGKVRIETQDPLAVDNEFLFVLNRREKLSVLIVDAGKQKQSFYLQKALTASEDLPFAVKVIPIQALNANELNTHTVVILNDIPRIPDAALVERMNGLRKTSQGQLVILGENSEMGWWGSQASFPLTPGRRIYVSKDRGRSAVSVTNIDRNHNIFKELERKAPSLTLNTGNFFAYTEVELKPGAEILAKFDDGLPFLVESSATDRGMLVLTSTMDLKDNLGWNDFPLKPAFVPFMDSIVRYLSRYSESRGSYALGEGIPIVGGMEGAVAIVITPENDRVSIGDLSGGQQRFYAPPLPGFYELRVGKDSRNIAVNPPSNEGNLDVMPPDELLASVQRTAADTRQSSTFFAEGAFEYGRRQMTWWYLLFIALLTGIAEIYVANKSQRGQVAGRKL